MLNETPHIIIDNYYNKNEEIAVWKELEYYNSLPKNMIERAETSSVAYEKGKPLGSSYRWYIDDYYTDKGRKQSAILNCTYKFIDKSITSEISKLNDLSNLYKGCNTIYSHVSYYDNNDIYKKHYDTFHFTVLIWFFKEPKKFKGGDLFLGDNNIKIECKQNRAVIFPCFLNHSVNKIEMFDDVNSNDKLGRYCITHFLSHQLNGNEQFAKYF